MAGSNIDEESDVLKVPFSSTGISIICVTEIIDSL